MIFGACFGVDHNASKGLKDFGEEMSARETDFEYYIPREVALHPQVPALILLHAQIRWSKWISAQWGKNSEVPFPNLAGIWTTMENQEPWEPAFPAGYTLPHENAYGGSDGSCPAPEPAYPAGGHAVDISTASVSEAAAVAAAAASIARAEAARRISGVRGSGSGASRGRGSWGRGGGGRGGGGGGSEDCLNSMVYNNVYVYGRWGLFRHSEAMRIITRKESLSGVEIPASSIEPKCKACPAFHVKGVCNTGCGNAADHFPHYREQDPPSGGGTFRPCRIPRLLWRQSPRK